jgi:hypothetical protein
LDEWNVWAYSENVAHIRFPDSDADHGDDDGDDDRETC